MNSVTKFGTWCEIAFSSNFALFLLKFSATALLNGSVSKQKKKIKKAKIRLIYTTQATLKSSLRR